jgi:L-alanine-DL-glutamate epimerase-like enolase superfamily enzyme
MIVTDVDIHVVSVPFTEPETWRFGRLWGLTSAIVEVHTDEGVTGLGETLGSPMIAPVIAALEANANWLRGADPLRVRSFVNDSRDRGWHHYPYIGNMATAALEMALWDIAGKTFGCPVHQFFGGAVRDLVPYYAYLPIPDRSPATARAQARAAVNDGFGTVYLKLGFDLDDDIALTAAVKDEVGPTIAVRVDANEGWSPFEAVRALEAFAAIGVEFVEEPIDMNNVESLARLRSQSQVRIGSNQSAWLPHDVRRVLTLGAADVVVSDPHQVGGLTAFRDVAALCESFGVPVVKHAFGDLGITTVATLHVLSTIHPPALAHQHFLGIVENDLLAEPLTFESGSLRVPDRPGLGIELNREALEHYKKMFTRFGEFEGYSPGFGPNPVPETELGWPHS